MVDSIKEVIVIGVSQGGLSALETVLPSLPNNFTKPVIIVQHRYPGDAEFLIRHLNSLSKIHVMAPDDKGPIKQGAAYIAPPDYHLMLEKNRTFSFSVDERVNFSRPSVDVLFESAADAYGKAVVGIVLTGANNDGAKGLHAIKNAGGIALVQDPDEAASRSMPEAAIKATTVDHILTLHQIGEYLIDLP